MNMIERVARAIYDAEDPLSGDPIAVTIHLSEHLFWDGVQPDVEMSDIDRQKLAIMEVCRAAAIAAIKEMREPTMDMLNSAVDATGAGSGMSWANRSPQKLFDVGYKAMIDAAAIDTGVGEG